MRGSPCPVTPHISLIDPEGCQDVDSWKIHSEGFQDGNLPVEDEIACPPLLAAGQQLVENPAGQQLVENPGGQKLGPQLEDDQDPAPAPVLGRIQLLPERRRQQGVG